MRKLLGINLLLALAVVFASCGTNNNVVNNRLISKRKFNKGFHINTKGNLKSSNEKKQEESIAFDDTKKRAVKEEKTGVKKTSKVNQKAVKQGKVSTIENEEVAFEEEAYEVKTTSPNPVARTGEDSPEMDEETAISDGYEAEVSEDQKSETKDSKKADKKRKKSKKTNSDDDVMFILIVILTILIPPLGVLIYTNIDWTKVLICLILSLLFFLPGMIYGLLVVLDVI